MAKKDLVVNIDSSTKGLEQGMAKSVNEVRKLENQTRKSKNEFKQFDDRIGKLASGNLSGLLGTLGSVAGVLAVAKGAQEGFNKTMRASQESSDDFDRAIMGAKGGVDFFFQSLNTGDWSDFFTNMGTAISKSRELYDALDKLSDMRYAEDYLSAEEGAKIAEYRAKLRDKSTTDEEREIIKKETQKILDEQLARALRKGEQAKKSKITAFQLATKMPNSTEEDIKLLNTIFGGQHEDEMESAIFLREERLKLEKRLSGRYDSGDSSLNYDREEDKKYLEQIKEKQKALEEIVPGITNAANAQKLYMESGMDEVNKLQKEQYGAVKAYWDAQGSLNRLLGIGDSNQTGGNTTASTAIIFDEGSIAHAEEAIKKRQKAVNEAIVGSENHKIAEMELAEAIDIKNNLLLQTAKSINVEDIDLSDLNKIKQKLVDILGTTTNKELKKEIDYLIKYYEREIDEIELNLEKEIKLNLQVGQPIMSGGAYNKDSVIEMGELLSEVRKMRRESTTKPGSFDFKKDIESIKGSEDVLRVENILSTLPDYQGKEQIDLRNRDDIEKYKSDLIKQIDAFETLLIDETDLDVINNYNIQLIKLRGELERIEEIDLIALFDEFGFDINKSGDLEYIDGIIKDLNDKKNTLINDIDDMSKEMLREVDVLKQAVAGDIVMKLSLEVKDIDAILEKLYAYQKVNNIVSENKWLKEADGARMLTESLYGVGSALNTIGSITDKTTADMLAGFSQILGGIAEMIPAIKTLTLMKNQEALSSAVASGAAIPFPLNLVAIASGVASVIAGISTSIPKFAEGGIVYGNTIAQVGEYAGASTNPEVIAPLSKLRDILADTQQGGSIGGAVDFRISGKDLVGVFNNYSSKQSKI